MKKHLLLILAATLAWCAAAQKRDPELHRLAGHHEGASQPTLVTSNDLSNVRVRTAPWVDVPQARVVGANDDTIPLFLYYGCLMPYVEQAEGWYKVGVGRWVSGTVTHAVPCPPIDSNMIGKVFERRRGDHGGVRSVIYRVCHIGDGLYVAEEALDLGTYTPSYYYRLLLGSRRGNVLCFPVAVWVVPMNNGDRGLRYASEASFAIEHENWFDRDGVRATYGDKEAMRLSDGTMGLDYAKLTDAQLLDLMKDAYRSPSDVYAGPKPFHSELHDAYPLPSEDVLYLNAHLLDSAHLRQPLVPLRPDGTPDYDAMLLGRHHASLNFISRTNFGEVLITKNPDGTYNVKGGQEAFKCSNDQESVENGDLLSISGTLTVEDEFNLLFDGVIVTKVYDLLEGQPCRREGQFYFKSTNGNRYWSMQEQEDLEGLCDEAVYNVDIYMPVLK